MIKKFFVVCLLLTSLLLSACGNEATGNNNFDAFVPDGLNPLTISADLRDALLVSNGATAIDQSVKVYSTNRALVDLQKSYTDEMIRRGWVDASPKIIGNTELGSQGVVQAFEKNVGGDVNKKHVLGIILLSPDVKNDLTTKINAGAGNNVVIAIESASGITPAPTTK